MVFLALVQHHFVQVDCRSGSSVGMICSADRTTLWRAHLSCFVVFPNQALMFSSRMLLMVQFCTFRQYPFPWLRYTHFHSYVARVTMVTLHSLWHCTRFHCYTTPISCSCSEDEKASKFEMSLKHSKLSRRKRKTLQFHF